MIFFLIAFVTITSLTGLIGFSILLPNYRHIHSSKWKNINYYSILYFSTLFFNWLNLLFHLCFSKYLIITNTIWCFTVISNPVFLFRMVEYYTGVNRSSARRLLSYGVPIVGFLIVCMIFFDRLISNPGNEPIFLMDSSPAVIVISVIGSGYMLMNLYVIWRYENGIGKKKFNIQEKKSLLGFFKGISLVLLLMSPAWFILVSDGIIFLLVTSILILVFSILHIFLATNILIITRGSRKVKNSETEKTHSVVNNSIQILGNESDKIQSSTVALPLNKKSFNEWMKRKKPYLNPELKVDELALFYGVSVRELSGFLNREYKMNFNRYINRCRLVELRQLKVKYKRAPLTKLVPMAGFGSMISYSRAKAAIEKKKEQV